MSDTGDRILVVDDDAALRALLRDYLTREGYRVETVEDGQSMDRWLSRHEADLIILDLMLPGEDGLSIARRMRVKSSIPIIILSARGEEIDRIVGLEIGADDYLPKPFNPRELLARMRAVLRRQGLGTETREPEKRLRFGPFELDLDALVLWRDGEQITLTSGEMGLLKIFAMNPNRVLDRDRLLDLLKGYERTPFDRSIDVQVARLRGKIEDESKNPRYIRTVWGKGYKFTPGGQNP